MKALICKGFILKYGGYSQILTGFIVDRRGGVLKPVN